MLDSRQKEIDAATFVDRTTFVITPDGKVAATFTTDAQAEGSIKPQEHAEKSLAAVESLHKH